MRKNKQMGGSRNPVGYCHYHKMTLSANQLHNRKCLERNCPRFQKYEQHGYWLHQVIERERNTAKCEAKREALQKRYEEFEKSKARRQKRRSK